MSRAEIKFTVADYNALPEHPRYELIEGALLLTPSPSTAHQHIAKRLVLLLGDWESRTKLGSVYFAPLDVILSNETVVQPDITVILNENRGIIKEKIVGAPDLMVEILSPSTSDRDRVLKKRLYYRHGVREYWVVDPRARTVEVSPWSTGGFDALMAFSYGETLVSPLLNRFQAPVCSIFE